MSRRVPLVRRSVLAEPRRFLAGVVGVGLALMLVLLVSGLWAGIRSQVTVYEDHTGAQLYVVEPGTRALFADTSTIPIARLADVRATAGVAWAAPVRAVFTILELHGKKVAASVVGWAPGQAGGPWKLRSGRLPAADNEVVVDGTLERRHGMAVGTAFSLAGRRFRVVGVSAGTSMFMTSLVFVRHSATDTLLRSPDTTSAILVGSRTPTATRARLEARDMSVLDRAEVRAEDLRLATKIYGTIIKAMVLIAFLAGTLIVALTGYSLVTERRREFGIIKAIGATPRRLIGFALGETLMVGSAGFVAAIGFAWAGRWLITAYRPQFAIVYTAADVGRAGLIAAVMALLASLIPARRLVRLDAAVAYRSEG
jgi:putative ABC transport system permease protein